MVRVARAVGVRWRSGSNRFRLRSDPAVRGRGQARAFGVSDLAAVLVTCNRPRRGAQRRVRTGRPQPRASCGKGRPMCRITAFRRAPVPDLPPALPRGSSAVARSCGTRPAGKAFSTGGNCKRRRLFLLQVYRRGLPRRRTPRRPDQAALPNARRAVVAHVRRIIPQHALNGGRFRGRGGHACPSACRCPNHRSKHCCRRCR